jgi:D-alanine-D-alanine ligase
MGKKLRVAVLYNEPVSGKAEEREFVSESGKLMSRPQNSRKNGQTKQKDQPEIIDASELGVLEEMEDIKSALSSSGYRTTTFNVDSDVFRLIDYLRDEKPDVIFNLVECVENESDQEMNVAGLYELLKIPYTGASALTLGIALHKPLVKQILASHGIRSPLSQVFRVNDKIDLDPQLSYPVIVKPSREDASIGISDDSVVYNLADLRKRTRYIFHEFDQPALVEQYIQGREVNVAIIGNKRPIVFPVSEIDFSGLTDDMHRIVSYDAKWAQGTIAYSGTKGVCPADLKPGREAELKEIALRCYRIIGCRDYARVDFRLADDGTPYVLEVNPNPDISDDAGFARSAKAYGLSFPQVVVKIVEYALERYR